MTYPPLFAPLLTLASLIFLAPVFGQERSEGVEQAGPWVTRGTDAPPLQESAPRWQLAGGLRHAQLLDVLADEEIDDWIARFGTAYRILSGGRHIEVGTRIAVHSQAVLEPGLAPPSAWVDLPFTVSPTVARIEEPGWALVTGPGWMRLLAHDASASELTVWSFPEGKRLGVATHVHRLIAARVVDDEVMALAQRPEGIERLRFAKGGSLAGRRTIAGNGEVTSDAAFVANDPKGALCLACWSPEERLELHRVYVPDDPKAAVESRVVKAPRPTFHDPNRGPFALVVDAARVGDKVIAAVGEESWGHSRGWVATFRWTDDQPLSHVANLFAGGISVDRAVAAEFWSGCFGAGVAVVRGSNGMPRILSSAPQQIGPGLELRSPGGDVLEKTSFDGYRPLGKSLSVDPSGRWAISAGDRVIDGGRRPPLRAQVYDLHDELRQSALWSVPDRIDLEVAPFANSTLPR